MFTYKVKWFNFYAFHSPSNICVRFTLCVGQMNQLMLLFIHLQWNVNFLLIFPISVSVSMPFFIQFYFVRFIWSAFINYNSKMEIKIERKNISVFIVDETKTAEKCLRTIENSQLKNERFGIDRHTLWGKQQFFSVVCTNEMEMRNTASTEWSEKTFFAYFSSFFLFVHRFYYLLLLSKCLKRCL